MLGHAADDRGQLPDLMAGRLAHRLTVSQIAAAAIAALRRMGQRPIAIGGQLTTVALMTRLTARLATPARYAPSAWGPAADRWTAAASC